MASNPSAGLETVAEVLARRLQEAGVELVFGLPGGETVEILDALRRRGLRFELAHNESSAVFMADATARLTGKPGVCLTTLGPGAANAMAGVAHVYLDRGPVLVITARTPDHLLPDYTHQVIDLHALYAPVTKGSFKLEPGEADQTICTALSLALGGRPGPVHLELSNETAVQAVGAGSAPGTPRLNDQPEPALTLGLAAAADVLTRSQRPIIVAGLGLEPERPYPALRRLAEAARAPVITTPKGKGCLPDDHPLAAGTIGLTRTDPAYALLDQADCIVALGFDVVELVKPWDQPAPLLWLAPWSNQAPTIPTQVELVGPMQPYLDDLAGLSFQPGPEWGESRVTAYRQSLAGQRRPEPGSGRMLPQAVLETLRQILPRETLVTTDVGSHKILSSLTWPSYAPNRFLVSNGLSCMGFALPAAIAGSLALPDQPVVCLIGDGGLAMVMGELGLLTRLQLPVIVVVFNDAALDLIRSQQIRAAKPVYGTEFSSPDFVSIARAYQLQAYRVTTGVECAQAIRAAIVAGRPTLIEAMIDPLSYPTTPASG
ncbi:MAG TPA: thiamine pyrophosphate-binding protein [Anaerolineae bacterium]|jgi:acetolactate synthase-1/2/3 large subunit